MDKSFSFCIGRPWDKDNPNHICTYAYGSEVFSGNLEDAINQRDFIRSRTRENDWEIYRLVKGLS